VLVVLAGWQVIQSRVAQYMASFLVLSGLMNGVFAALDGLLFYVFFEATLIPMFIIIGVWGGENRVYASSTRCSVRCSRWLRSSISTTHPAAASRSSTGTNCGSGCGRRSCSSLRSSRRSR
jgi:NADH:ubiquinone oxidoreductase subunit 5 (subunit L)/multisubunit Na+/H+ antiporter MnhA subunit